MIVLDWLLDSDPAIRWQVARSCPGAVRLRRGRARASGNRGLGCGARLLALHPTSSSQWTGPQAFKISSLYLRKETYHGDA